MSNSTTLRVYFDEDIDLETEEELASELEYELIDIKGIVAVDTLRVFTSDPPEADVEVEFDDSVLSVDALRYEISTLSLIHNAQ